MKNLFRLASVLFILALTFSTLGSAVPKVSALDAVEIVSVEAPGVVAPGQSICFKVTIKVNSGQLLESRGDMLRNTDGNLFGHWPHIAVVGTVNSGQTYTFQCYGGMVAPTSEGTYESKWRVWQNSAYVGQEAVVRFEVKIGGGGGEPPHTDIPFDKLEPGDIILMRNDDRVGKAQSLIYGGYWSHTLIVTEIRNGIPYVAEAYADPPDRFGNPDPGVVSNPINKSSAWTALDAAIVRVKASGTIRNQGGAYALSKVGKPYNWYFWDKWTQDAFYCSQLGWSAYYYPNQIDLDSNQSMVGMVLRGLFVPGYQPLNSTLVSLLSDAVVTPDDLYHSSNVELVGLATKGAGRQFKRMIIWAFSPVDLYLVDSEGHSIGTDPQSGAEVNNIPGAFYSGSDSEPEFIVIQDLTGDWTLHVSGTDSGKYSLIAEDASTQHSIVESNGTTTVGVDAVYYLDFDSNNAPSMVPQDQNSTDDNSIA